MLLRSNFTIEPDIVPVSDDYELKRMESLKNRSFIDLGRLIEKQIPFKEIPDEPRRKLELTFLVFDPEKWHDFQKDLEILVKQMKPGNHQYWLKQIDGLIKELDKIKTDAG